MNEQSSLISQVSSLTTVLEAERNKKYLLEIFIYDAEPELKYLKNFI
jgi:hypothetical protein